jgi:hypothetical protein
MMALPIYYLEKKFKTGSTSAKALSPVDPFSKN